MSTFYFVVVYNLVKNHFIVTYRSDLKLYCNQLIEQDVLCTDCAGFVAGLYSVCRNYTYDIKGIYM